MAIVRETRTWQEEFTSRFLVYTTGTGGGIDFGFNAEHIRLKNRGGVSLFFSLGSSVATTASPELPAGDTFEAYLPASVRGLGHLSTTTSTAANDSLVTVDAWG